MPTIIVILTTQNWQINKNPSKKLKKKKNRKLLGLKINFQSFNKMFINF